MTDGRVLHRRVDRRHRRFPRTPIRRPITFTAMSPSPEGVTKAIYQYELINRKSPYEIAHLLWPNDD